jgi:photosystem II stability/assembly factor-like uncharacterized protein
MTVSTVSWLLNIYALAVSPDFARDQTLFAATDTGLYRSTDAGQTWQDVYGSLALPAPLPTSAIALSPDFATDDTLFAGSPGAILRSANRGQTWQLALLPSPGPTIAALAVSPNFTEDGVVLAGTLEDGVLRSADRGRTWSGWNFGLLDLNIVSMAISPAFVRDQTIFVGTESGLFRSSNGGRAWRVVDTPMEYATVNALACAPDYAETGDVFVGVSGLFVLNHKTGGWRQLLKESVGATSTMLVTAQDSGQPRILAAADGVALISQDGGASWSELRNELFAEYNISAIAAPPGANSPLYIGTLGGGILITK